ncbi:MAG: hypothetical protein HPY44_06980 [Armatimonadetes bacterium]|nr:hypothetical protein [Armatimonadota bacterium]
MASDRSPGPAQSRISGSVFHPWWLWTLAAAVGAVIGAGWAMGSRQPASPVNPFPISPTAAAAVNSGGLYEVRFRVGGSKVEAAELVPAGVTEITAQADLGDSGDGAPVTAKWWWTGDPQEAPRVVRKRSSGRTRVTAVLRLPGDRVPFTPGVGEVEFHRSGERVARGSFVVCADADAILAQADATGRPTVVDQVQTSRAVGADGSPVSPTDRFGPGDRVYVVFRYRLAVPGTEFRVNWYAGGTEIGRAQTRIVAQSAEGWGHAWLSAGGSGLPAGEYQATVTYGTSPKVMGKTFFRVTGRADVSSRRSP